MMNSQKIWGEISTRTKSIDGIYDNITKWKVSRESVEGDSTLVDGKETKARST